LLLIRWVGEGEKGVEGGVVERGSSLMNAREKGGKGL